MLNFGVVRPDRTIIREDGKKFVCYRSAIKTATVELDSGQLKVDVVVNRDLADRYTSPQSGAGISSPTKLTSEGQKIAPTIKA